VVLFEFTSAFIQGEADERCVLSEGNEEVLTGVKGMGD